VRGTEVFLAFLSSSPLTVGDLRASIRSRLVAKKDYVPALLALGRDPQGLAEEVGVVHILKP
jgi:hypothetical protein